MDQPDAAARPRRTVLEVDDDAATLEAVATCLEYEGYTVVTAKHGEAGLEAAARERPAVILLDMNMPGVDGWEFTRRYRALAEHPAQIVCMTAAADPPARCREIGADGCLPKPFELDALFAAVEHPQHAHP
jgi:urea transport system substrate-binding protein